MVKTATSSPCGVPSPVSCSMTGPRLKPPRMSSRFVAAEMHAVQSAGFIEMARAVSIARLGASSRRPAAPRMHHRPRYHDIAGSRVLLPIASATISAESPSWSPWSASCLVTPTMSPITRWTARPALWTHRVRVDQTGVREALQHPSEARARDGARNYQETEVAGRQVAESILFRALTTAAGLHGSPDYTAAGLDGPPDHTVRQTTRVARLHGPPDYTGRRTTRAAGLHGSPNYTSRRTTRVARLHGRRITRPPDYTSRRTTRVARLHGRRITRPPDYTSRRTARVA
jgi:hypothetical protein